jgi:hypothetical protein
MANGFGRPPLRAEDRLTEHLDIRLSPRQLADLRDACAELDIDLSNATREALDEFVGDFRERRLFDRRTREQPVRRDRRRSPYRRRVHVGILPPATASPST